MSPGASLVDLALARQERDRAASLDDVRGEEPRALCKVCGTRPLWRNNTTGVCAYCQRAHLGLARCRGCGEPLDTRYRVVYCVTCRRGDGLLVAA